MIGLTLQTQVFCGDWSFSVLPKIQGQDFTPVAISNGYIYGNISGYRGGAAKVRPGSTQFIPLTSGHATYTTISGANDFARVGSSVIDEDSHIGYWFGNANSWVDMQVPTSLHFVLTSPSTEYQCGYAYSENYYVSHAYVAMGSKDTWQDIHPFGYLNSYIRALDGEIAAGEVDRHAYVWNLATNVGTDLNPTNVQESHIVAAAGGAQVGFISSGAIRASLWRGTRESRVDLHPAMFQGNSEVTGATEGIQCGAAITYPGQIAHACLWFGTRESYLDLNPYMHSTYETAFALAVGKTERSIIVFGKAKKHTSSDFEYVLWTKTLN